MLKRGQIPAKVFSYLLGAIIIAVIFMLGLNIISDTSARISDTELQFLENQLAQDVTAVSKDFGTVNSVSYKVPTDTQLCIVDRSHDTQILESNLISFYPLIEDVLRSDSQGNTFLHGADIFEQFFVGDIRINMFPYFVCLSSEQNTVAFQLQGEGNAAAFATSMIASGPLDEDETIVIQSLDGIIEIMVDPQTNPAADELTIRIVSPADVNGLSDVYDIQPVGLFSPALQMWVGYISSDFTSCPTELSYYQVAVDGTVLETISNEIDCENARALFVLGELI